MTSFATSRIKLFSSFQKNENDLFYFSGVGFSDNDIFMGCTADKDFVSSISNVVEGRFFLVNSVENKITFKTDCTGQELLFYYKNEHNWAISNSFKKLCEHLHENSVKLTTNYASLIPFQGEHSFCEALITDTTVVNEIRILGIKEELEIDENNILKVKKIKYETPDNLLDIAEKYIKNWTSRLRTLVDSLPEGAINCDLSGGVDSRLVLALLMASGCDLKKIEFVSNPSATVDLEIAKKIADFYSLNLNNTKKSKRQILSSREKLDLTLYSSLGVYHGFYLPSNIRNEESIHLHGGGGGLFRQVFNHNFEEILLNQAEFFPNSIFLARSIEQLMMFDRKRIDTHDLPPSERSICYFYQTRNRYHFGRDWFKSLDGNLITPLISNDILKMRFLAKDILDDKELYLLMFLLTAPELLEFEFDKEEKKFSKGSIDKVKNVINSQSSFKLKSDKTKGKLFVKFDDYETKLSPNNRGDRRTPIEILYDEAYVIYEQINKSTLSTKFVEQIEGFFKTKNLTKKAARSYLYLHLLDFLSKFTVEQELKKIHHNDVLAEVWDKKIYKNSPTIVNSLNNKGLNYYLNDNDCITVKYGVLKEFNIKQNLMLNGRHKQPLFLDKVKTKENLQKYVKVAQGKVFNKNEIKTAWKFLCTLKTKSAVVKPISGVGGQGITTDIKTFKELKSAVALIKEKDFLLEEFFHGNDYRIYVVAGKAIAATLRKAPQVIGDGVKTLSELIIEKKIERSLKPYFKKHEIDVDNSIYQKYPSDSIPALGQIVNLNDTGNISRGGESYDVSELMHESFQTIAADCWLAYKCIPDHFAVDLICEDISKDIHGQNYIILELNAKPGHGQHVYPYLGSSRRLSDKIVDYWFPR